ncbi:MAG: hypothetical protein K2L14_08040, partial [Duncaniella sp.]|nr:hypothetical protein [Duncaniella sp.]
MKRSLFYLLLCITALANVSLRADEAYNPSPTGFKDLVTEPSPEVAALNRHIDCPVSYATGSYTLSVPLFSWDECGFPISLSLDYSPGIKAEDKAGIFGLGWSLGGITGTISRQVIGLPDENEKFYILDNNIHDFLDSPDVSDLRDLARGKKDAYADKFYYSITGYSGCFIILNRNIVKLSDDDVTIQCTEWSDEVPKKFSIKTPEGWKYQFIAKGYSSKQTQLLNFSFPHISTDYNALTLWALSEVVLPDAVSTISLTAYSANYEKENKQDLYTIPCGEKGSTGSTDQSPVSSRVYTSNTGFGGFTKIASSQATVTFGMPSGTMTGEVKDRSGNIVRKFVFEFDTSIPERKKLKSVTILSGNEVIDRRTFDYHPDSYSANRPSACSDFFGYSNRNTPFYTDTVAFHTSILNPGGVKDQIGWEYDPLKKEYTIYRADTVPVIESILKMDGKLNPHRLYNFKHACSASLKEMTDANGLITRIIYEPNVAPLSVLASNENVNVNIGIRVAKIVTEDKVSKRTKTRSFHYQSPVFTLPLGSLRKQDFASHSGAVTFNQVGAYMNQSQTTTLTASCRVPGMSAENATILYGVVEETVESSDLPQPIKTRYEFDNTYSTNTSFGVSTQCISREIYPAKYLGYGVIDNPLDPNSLVKNNDLRFGFSERFYQKSPLKRKVIYEGNGKGGYKAVEETVNIYSHRLSDIIYTGVYCEPLMRATYDAQGIPRYKENITDFISGRAFVERGRTYLDSTIIIKYFPDGSSRRIDTRYVYPDRDLASVKNVFPDEESYIHEGSLHRPVGTIVKCAGTTIAKYDLLSDHISTYGTFGSLTRTLPVISRTIVNNSREFSTYVHYGKFGSNLLPSRYETLGKDGEPIIDWLAVDSYNSRRQPLKVRRHASPTMVYSYQADGQALSSIAIEGTSLKKLYTHQPLVGYTSATSPAGNTTYYEYSGSRLSRILDRDHNPVKAYEYHLFSPDDYGHGYIRETTYLAAGGKQPMSALQIFDSYGEQYATIAENASAPNVDIVNFSRLDALGRPVRQYLPFPAASGYDRQALTLRADSIARSFYSDTTPFTATEYIHGSASTTPAITIDAGSDHADRITRVAEKCNNTTETSLQCIRMEMSGRNNFRCLGYWPAGSLDVTEVKDADGARVLEFTDFRGQKLLSRRILDGGNLDTYYVYDEWGNLCLALSPEASAILPARSSAINVTTNAMMLDYAYHYVYDEANRLISKKLPGAEKITYTYDADGLPAFTQDGNMRRDDKAMFTLYDAAGRVVVTGTCSSSVMNSAESLHMRATYSASQLGVDSTRYVTDVQLPSAQMLSATYYDAVPAYLGVNCSRSDVLAAPAGLVTAQVDRVLGSSVRSRVYTVNFYDKLERVVFSQQAVADNSLLKTTTTYDFAGNPSSVSTTSYIGNNTFTDTYTYGYDHLNRPTTVSLRHGDKTYPLISNTYDNLGRLRSNGAPGKAAATFGYDMRSALSSINSYHFIQTLNRGDGDSKYRSKSGRITRNDILLTGRHLTFDYLYDGVGRLTRAEAKLHSPEINYTEEFDYDLNTNIIGLRRYGAKNATAGALLDDLTMTYEGNQLRYITDDATDYPYEASLDFRAKAPIESTPGASVAAPFGLIGGLNPIDTTTTKPGSGTLKPLPDPVFNYSADYAYDANGNMTQDRHSSITSIAYNVLNLPQTVTYEGTLANRPVSQTVYDASGRKHIVRNGATVLSKFRGDETRYIGDYIMVNDTIDRLQTPYGYLRDGVFHSYVFDYQGNVMAVVAGNDVTQTNLYYADGLPMNTSTNPTTNAFKYTAKELSLFRGLPVYDYT